MRRAVLALVALAACEPEQAPLALPAPDQASFETSAYPVLLADCGFPACHGSHERFLALFGPGRQRLSPDSLAYDPPTPEELALSFTRASSMLVSEEGVRRAPLLRKPLAVEAGGSGHEGDDPWGRAIYTTKQDPRYEALFFWAITAEAP
jgi:hypothetical protein